MKEGGVKASELKRAKQMARVNILLSEESSSAQMGRLARNELYFGEQKTTEATLAAVEGVTLEDVQRVALEMFDAQFINLAAIGPIQGELAFEI